MLTVTAKQSQSNSQSQMFNITKLSTFKCPSKGFHFSTNSSLTKFMKWAANFFLPVFCSSPPLKITQDHDPYLYLLKLFNPKKRISCARYREIIHKISLSLVDYHFYFRFANNKSTRLRCLNRSKNKRKQKYFQRSAMIL